MLKFENMIRNLNLEQKATLITSSELKNNSIIHYDFPLFTVVSDMVDKAPNVVLPTYHQLGQTWNEELISTFGEELSSNMIYYKHRNMLGASTLTEGDNSFGQYQYLVGKLAAAEIRGIEKGGAFACLNKAPNAYDSTFLASEIALKEGAPSAFVSTNDSSVKTLNDVYFNGLRISYAATEAEVIQSVYNGNHLTVSTELDAKKCVVTAAKEYKRAKDEYLHGKITLADLNSLEKMVSF